MARPYRIQGENCIYHITSRGNGRDDIFHSEKDFCRFLEYLKKAKDKFRFYLYAYCLMDNHYHLFLETTLPNLSRAMQYINTSYTVYHNVKHKKSGHLFQGRYKSILVEADGYFLELSRYIHLNPVRAKKVTSPGEYKWSGYNECIGKAGTGLIDKAEMEAYFKMANSEYEKFVLEGIDRKSSPFESLYAGSILGSERFIKETIADLKIEVESKDFAYKREMQTSNPLEVINTVAKFYKVEPDILRKSANRPLLAKKAAIYLLKNLTAMTNKEIGKEFGISYSAVSKATGDMERLMGENKKTKSEIHRIISHFKV